MEPHASLESREAFFKMTVGEFNENISLADKVVELESTIEKQKSEINTLEWDNSQKQLEIDRLKQEPQLQEELKKCKEVIKYYENYTSTLHQEGSVFENGPFNDYVQFAYLAKEPSERNLENAKKLLAEKEKELEGTGEIVESIYYNHVETCTHELGRTQEIIDIRKLVTPALASGNPANPPYYIDTSSVK
ncbi:hypothetical protein HONESTABE_91 [Bacillus phage HonestAbe]|uniref:hypothetical protein n=1 Tax=Bacillus phage Zuko TaxID=1805956 RepID=UPI0007A76F75|nr:hypothetical protein BI001_gp285 [Bacillus phage Zuko]AMW62378.1 hypothetical protein ZUKO_93 [Bacillus phage Zuko]AUV57728.1 hypothetical protein HONESTABE_91 [Bacillus phage HonestAbe]AXF41915.1 hypothetical protein [Bacillus phage Saddex]